MLLRGSSMWPAYSDLGHQKNTGEGELTRDDKPTPVERRDNSHFRHGENTRHGQRPSYGPSLHVLVFG